MKKTEKKPFLVKPTIYAACVELTGSPVAGGLLCQMVIRSGMKTLIDEHGQKGWLALTALQWRAVTGFTKNQHNDAISLLKVKSLIGYRRRKLKKKDSAALAWFRVPEATKSAIAEIMDRPGISAFPEKSEEVIFENSEKTLSLNSGEADSLKEMNILKNEKEEENVIVEKIVTEGSIASQEGSQKKSKKGDNADKKWFVKTLSEIYEGSHYTAEPYQNSACETLRDIMEWLSTNPGKFHASCQGYPDPVKGALSAVIHHWLPFCEFSRDWYKTYGASPVPQIWSLKHQQKAIPDYIKFLAYFREVQARAEKAEREIPKDEEQGKFSEGYYSWQKVGDAEKEKLVSVVVGKLKIPFSKKTSPLKFKVHSGAL